MSRRKPKPKAKPKAKGKAKQQPSKATKLLLTHGGGAEIVRVAGFQGVSEDVASAIETLAELEHSATPVKLRDEVAEPAGPVEVVAETEEWARIVETPVEIENVADSVELRDEAAELVSTGDTPSEAEQLESIFEIQVNVANTSSPAEIRDTTGNASAPQGIYSGAEIPTIPLGIPVVAEGPVRHVPTPAGADRRAHPRYAFTAAVEVVAAELGARIKTQVRDLSQQGCYVDTSKPLALGSATELRITKGAIAFEARARVVYNQADKGMGLMFTAVEPQHLKTLDAWIAESRESSWRAANRRRSQRVLMKVPVQVSGKAANGANFEERTHTLSISAHGALIGVEAAVQRGQRFILSNLQTKAALECVVVYLERIPGEPMQVGVDFMLPNPTFWRVAFPPKDWTSRHPDAKSIR
jgi:hypothetical protein